MKGSLTTDSKLKQRLQQLSARRSAGPQATQVNEFLAAMLTSSIGHVYGVPGRPVYELYRRLAQYGAKLVGTKNQQSAVLASAAQNYLAGQLTSAVVLSGGPAFTNAITGLLVAKRNGWPLLLIVGGEQSSTPSRGHFQHLDISATAAEFCKSIYIPDTIDDLRQTLQSAVSDAQKPPYGPVVISLTAELLSAKVGSLEDHQLSLPLNESKTEDVLTTADVRDVVQLISQADRPLLVLGETLRWMESTAQTKTWVDAGLPYLTALDYKALPTRHPLCADQVAAQALNEADLLITLGAPFDWRLRFGAEVSAGTPVLVFEAADEHQFPAHLQRVRYFKGDFETSARLLLDEVELSPHIQPWRTRIQSLVSSASTTAAAQNQKHPRLDQLAQALRDCLPENATLVLDGNECMLAARRHIQFNSETLGLTPGITGCMGVGLPFALAAQLQRPDQRVVCLTGDTAFGICAMEFETACRHQLPIIVVVANNQGNGAETLSPAPNYTVPPGSSDLVSTTAPGLSYELIASAFGGHGERVTRTEDLSAAMTRALNSAKPACINVILNSSG